jgi:homeobox protein cut-like
MLLTRRLGLDFTALVSNLDNTASEIVAYQRDSTVQRKDLAQKTKDFRKMDDASKLTEIKGLLKGAPARPPTPPNWD